MYVCVCHAITDRDIKGAVAGGCCSLRQLREQLGVGKTCGRCARCARETMQEFASPRHQQPHLAVQLGSA